MKNSVAIVLATLTATCGLFQVAHAQSDSRTPNASAVEPALELTPAQRSAIYRAVSKDKSKVSPRQFPAVVGASVPPMIELYTLPDDAVSGDQVAKFFQYTMVQDQVVLVDPTKMRVVGIIGPNADQ